MKILFRNKRNWLPIIVDSGCRIYLFAHIVTSCWVPSKFSSGDPTFWSNQKPWRANTRELARNIQDINWWSERGSQNQLWTLIRSSAKRPSKAKKRWKRCRWDLLNMEARSGIEIKMKIPSSIICKSFTIPSTQPASSSHLRLQGGRDRRRSKDQFQKEM